MGENIRCDCCGNNFSNAIPDDIEFWEIENKHLCWNCKNQLGLTDCCDCGNEMYINENEFDLDLCPECLQSKLQDEIDKATYYDIYNENLKDIYN